MSGYVVLLKNLYVDRYPIDIKMVENLEKSAFTVSIEEAAKEGKVLKNSVNMGLFRLWFGLRSSHFLIKSTLQAPYKNIL